MRFFVLLFLGYINTGRPDVNRDYVITYSFILQEYESDVNSVRKGEAILISYGDSSIFMDKAQYVRDSLNNSPALQKMGRTERLSIVSGQERPSFRYSVYKNYIEAVVKYQEPINGVLFAYEEPLPEIDWEILRDTLTISGYVCQKAVGKYAGRTYEAWFSSEIPIRDGPYKLGGLPGLIFRLEDTEGKIKFSLTGLALKSGEYNPRIPERNKVSRKEFQKRKDHYYMNRAEYRKNGGGNRRIVVNGKEETMEEFYEGIKQEYLDQVRIEIE